MKKSFLIVLLLGISVLTYIIYYFYPKEVHINDLGIKYKLGKGNVEYEQEVNVSIEGTIYKSIAGDRTFKGKIEFEGEEISVPQEYRELEVGLDQYHSGLVIYNYVGNGKPFMHAVGTIYFNKSFDAFSIALLDYSNENQKGWSSDSGLMITAPASDRRTAIAISNKLMSEHLNGIILE